MATPTSFSLVCMADTDASNSADEERSIVRRETIGLLLGPLSFGTVLATMPLTASPEANAVFACTCWIAIWWVTEAVPIPVTSLLPIPLFPLTGIQSVGETTAPYADPIIFLLLGGFLLALAVERSELHRRIALLITTVIGFTPGRIVFGFMLATAVLSMWISNTATAMMMVPIGTAVILQVTSVAAPDIVDDSNIEIDTSVEDTQDMDVVAESIPETPYGIALMLAIAYGASIGGAATLIGSPPNAVFAGIAGSRLGVEIGFLQWMLFAVPGSAVFLFLTWVTLMKLLRPGEELANASSGSQLAVEKIGTTIREQREALGPMSRAERRVSAVFAAVALGWLLRPFVLEPLFPAISDEIIAILGGIALFVVPVDLGRREFLLEWDDVSRLPWGVLILLGAGFSLASAFQSSELDLWIADQLTGLVGLSLLALFALIAAVVVSLTEVNSNTATATVFMPIMIGLGATIGVDPLTLMGLTALAASYAFMLPVATPPNAIVFGSGYLTIPQMVSVGVWLNLIGIALVAVLTYLWFPVIFG